MKNDELIDAIELAEKLNCCRRTIANLVKRRKIPVVRVGRKLRFDYDSVVQALTVCHLQTHRS